MGMQRTWQMMVMAGLMLGWAWTGPAHGESVFGTPKNLGPAVNCGLCEYDPSISSDGLELYFSSCRPGTYGVQDIWVIKRPTPQDEWSEPENLGPTINSSVQELGPSISADGLSLYFSAIRNDGEGSHDLYVTRRVSRDQPWGPPVSLGDGINTVSDDISPFISADGLTLLFGDAEWGTPVRPGGSGQADLWMSTRTCPCSPWSPPVNLGNSVNSSSIDGGACLSRDGLALFFNSTRPGGVGQWDIWVCTRTSTQDRWRAAINLGTSINRPGWDGNPCLSADGRTLYFSSDRAGSFGFTDLWEVSVDPIGDFNGDGKIDETEVRILTENLGTDDPTCDIAPAPFGNGIVDMNDMAVLTQLASVEFVDPTLVACWKFDEAEGTTACDSTEACNGELVGGPVWLPDAGAVGGALQLDGIDDHVAATFNGNPSERPLSIFAWVKGGKAGQVILSQYSGANWLVANGAKGALATELQSDGRIGKPLSSQTAITDGNWHRVGLVWDGAQRILYVDGAAVAEDPQNSLRSAYGKLHIGGGKDLAAGSFWSGLIDDVRIYNRVIQP